VSGLQGIEGSRRMPALEMRISRCVSLSRMKSETARREDWVVRSHGKLRNINPWTHLNNARLGV
jgi:hypothetical protein